MDGRITPEEESGEREAGWGSVVEMVSWVLAELFALRHRQKGMLTGSWMRGLVFREGLG